MLRTLSRINSKRFYSTSYKPESFWKITGRIVIPLTIETNHTLYQMIHDIPIIDGSYHSGLHILSIGALGYGLAKLETSQLNFEDKLGAIFLSISTSYIIAELFMMYQL